MTLKETEFLVQKDTLKIIINIFRVMRVYHITNVKEFTVVLILVITFHIGNMVNSHYSEDINYNFQGIFLN